MMFKSSGPPPSSPIKSGRSITNDYSNNGNWISAIDEETGQTYLYNDITGESKWPSAPNTPAPQTYRSRKDDEQYDNNNDNNNDNFYDNMAEERYGDWIRLYDDNQQNYYYYNDKTGESKWQVEEEEQEQDLMKDTNDNYLKNMALYESEG